MDVPPLSVIAIQTNALRILITNHTLRPTPQKKKKKILITNSKKLFEDEI